MNDAFWFSFCKKSSIFLSLVKEDKDLVGLKY